MKIESTEKYESNSVKTYLSQNTVAKFIHLKFVPKLSVLKILIRKDMKMVTKNNVRKCR